MENTVDLNKTLIISKYPFKIGIQMNNQEEGLVKTEERINDNYYIGQSGCLKYIVNSKGKVVSEGYHSFTVFKHGDFTALAAKVGSMTRLLKLPETIDSFFEESPSGFFRLNYDKEIGCFVSQTGAMKHIFDMNIGKEITEGYHSMFRRGNKLYGEIGAHVEEVKFLNDCNYRRLNGVNVLSFS